MADNKTALGVDENIAGLLCYILGFITGIVFLLIEKENKFVRFHAMQSLMTFLGIFIISIIGGFIPIIGWIISILLVPISAILWILLMFKAYKGEKYKLPFIGNYAEEQIGS